LANTSAVDLATEVLEACLRDGTWPSRALDALIERALDESDLFVARSATRALFTIVIERLADLFDPHLCDVYAQLFSHVLARALPEYNARDLLVRYRNVRNVRKFPGGEIHRVYVLSRVTLGADVAVTSVLMDAAKQRFPEAEISFVGPEKNAELFAADNQVTPLPVVYGRSSLLRERLSAAVELQTLVDEPGTIVLDPDSRLTQLGLIPICDDSRYYFFESRAFGGELDTTLPDLSAEWAAEVFDVQAARPYLAPAPQEPVGRVAVSLGVGENASKRMDTEFEQKLLSHLVKLGKPIIIDCGAGGDESERVNALVQLLGNPASIHLHDGSYASFASHILQSGLYIGYDSAGQHVASAGRIPLISIFAGFVSERMFQRWRPTGQHAHVIRVDEADRCSAFIRTVAAISAEAADPE
jgi:ADP-heptose:LPS heptosyltransferase